MNITFDSERFNYLCDISPEREIYGDVKEFSPQNKYANKKGLKLHTYGDGTFCKFKIPSGYSEAGVYILCADESPKYVGECENLSVRLNSGYGNISPRNCFTGGQQTNCRINKLILDIIKKGNHIKLFFQETNDRFSLEDRLIEKIHPEWNRTKGTKRPPRDKKPDTKSSYASRSKYHKLQKYLQDNTKTEVADMRVHNKN